MSDAEKAIEAAKAEGRSEATKTNQTRIAKAELKAAAAIARVTIPKGLDDLVDFSRLVDKDGNPDEALIATLVDSFKPETPTFDQNLGIGRQSTGAASEADYTPEAIAKRVLAKNPY